MLTSKTSFQYFKSLTPVFAVSAVILLSAILYFDNLQFILFINLMLLVMIILFFFITRNTLKYKENQDRRIYSLRSVIEAMPVGVMLINKEKKIIDINKTAMELFDFKDKDEARENHCYNCIPAKKEGNCGQTHICPVMDKQKSFKNIQGYMMNSKGDVIDILKTAVMINYNDEDIVVETFVDISELEEARKSLSESEQRLDQALQGAELGIWDWMIRPGKLQINDRMKDMLSYDGTELNIDIKTWEESIHPDDFDKVMQALDFHLSDMKSFFEVEYRSIAKKDETKWFYTKAKIVERDEMNRPVRISGTQLDISNRKKSEELLQLSQERFITVLDSIEAIIYVSDMKTGETLFVNTYTEELFGEVASHVCWQKIFPCIDSHDKVCINDKIIDDKGQAKRGHIWEFQHPILGTWYEIHDRAIKWVDGSIVRFEVAYDITQRKQSIDAMTVAKKTAEDANQMKSEFLANMSHEIRTPMNAILGFSEILLQNANNEKDKSYLSTILASGHTLLELINDILDLSKIESGKLDLQIEPVNLKYLISEMVQIFQQKAANKDIEIYSVGTELLPDAISMDGVRVRQILLNLIGNAVKFTEKGHVLIKCSCEYISEDDCNLELSVEDTGIGIPDDQHQLIFESFRQQSGQNNRQYGGTGLGLAITSKLVKIMHGSITLDSQLGAGSAFSIQFENLPFSDMVSNESENKWNVDDYQFRPARILLVDDIEYNRELVQGYLETYEFTIDEAVNGAEAVELASKNIYDLVLMDIRMPVMDGYAATDIIKQQYFYPVVALTASTMKDDDAKIALCFDGFLKKPLSRKSLITTLDTFLVGSKSNKNEKSEEEVLVDSVQYTTEEVENIQYVLTTIIELFEQKFPTENNYMELDTVEEFIVAVNHIDFDQPIEAFDTSFADLNSSFETMDFLTLSVHLKKYIDTVKTLKKIIK